ncbi:hypothetical protein CA12_05020 [Alienimonas californiensis]|uniref:Tll0287-like domain-containing protein n=2 Tax=Alienimonas californiensis TaxID=2527989 RepID=A0A517P4Y2_9PLAN|nr:hypothetical protein CA12_05020 [Alienimonas californiensis]
MQLKRISLFLTAIATITLGGIALAQTATTEPVATTADDTVKRIDAADDSEPIGENSPTTVVEARGRARLLHDTLHGSLQVMHRDYFREDEGLKVPSRSLEDVFSELARIHGVKLHWIAVDLKPMSVDNKAETEFEKEAVRVLRSGEEEFESVADSEFRFAGRIRLSATCLGCHASGRSNNDDRAAGLVITMPLKRAD